MKEQALALARGAADPDQARNRLREYLQILVLRSFSESEAFLSLAFLGGTALRILHGLPRFSEGLDFSLQHALDQSQGAGEIVAGAWRKVLRKRLAVLGIDEAQRDIAPFLERPKDAALVARENLLGLLR